MVPIIILLILGLFLGLFWGFYDHKLGKGSLGQLVISMFFVLLGLVTLFCVLSDIHTIFTASHTSGKGVVIKKNIFEQPILNKKEFDLNQITKLVINKQVYRLEATVSGKTVCIPSNGQLDKQYEAFSNFLANKNAPDYCIQNQGNISNDDKLMFACLGLLFLAGGLFFLGAFVYGSSCGATRESLLELPDNLSQLIIHKK